MCYNCGCSLPDDPMGDERNITNKTLKQLSQKKNISFDELKKDLLAQLHAGTSMNDADYKKMFQDASEAWGQRIEDAQRETEALLKKVTK